MSQIPPFAWEKIATTDDLRAFEERLTGRDTLQAVAASNRTVILAMVGAVAAIGALAVALAGLAG